ncbi:MAG: DEAD/DEAH box helicase family protein [Deltaproteobacteria bacterium]|nr:DEAD/DEAH box helicase family protein [Deltaproteobacteria bacterium]
MSLRDVDIKIDYTGRGRDILDHFLLPTLEQSSEYDRITSFFTSESLVAIAEGLEALWRRGGRMRLVLGIHDVPFDLAQAAIDSDDSVAEAIAAVRSRLIAELATISDELAVDRLTTIAWMMQDGLLEVRVAAPSVISDERTGLFHNKALIFRDESGGSIAAVGSPNETGSGLGANFEHLTVFTSWDQPAYTEAQEQFFERLWNDDHVDVTVRPLDVTFAAEILDALPSRDRIATTDRPGGLQLKHLLRAAAEMPSLAVVSGRHAALFPHQERAFIDALSRWPVRVMLADEVGLGKTFEAGAVLDYLLRHTATEKALILVPKAVMHQWQAELHEHFGINAWVYESSRRTYFSFDGQARLVTDERMPYGANAPDVTIMSAQFARGTRKKGNVFPDGSMVPDVLVVDEAHAARVRPDLSGDEKPTLMWRLLAELMPRIPHVVFATATPMQVHWREYHALLELLGLPEVWEDTANYEASLSLVIEEGVPTLHGAQRASDLLIGTWQEMRPLGCALDPEERAFLGKLTAPKMDATARALLAQDDWPVCKRLLTKLHPARYLTVRNTRTALEAVGYSFPERNLEAPALSMPSDVVTFYAHVEEYLEKVYFDLERELYPDKKFKIGFVKCSYQQRLASSLEACHLSLGRRRERVRVVLEHENYAGLATGLLDELEDSDLFDDDTLPSALESVTNTDAITERVLHAARIEGQYLDGLLQSLERILDGVSDPKMTHAISLCRTHLEAADKILIFSRYTDTLDSVISAYRDAGGAGELTPYGIYTGKKAEIDMGMGPEPSTRREIRRALERGLIRVVFCSDAASEGLNLQSARVLINVDVPWNPARLEQRIGRIDRLGQRASSVDIYNLWYPDSIEARMYKRLSERKDLYELAVGEFPEVVSAAIRAELSTKYGTRMSVAEPVTELQRLRGDVQVSALRQLWIRDASGDTVARRFRLQLGELASAGAVAAGGSVLDGSREVTLEVGQEQVRYSLEPGDESVISLSHDAMRWVGDLPVRSLPEGLTVLCAGGDPVVFSRAVDDELVVVPSMDVPTLLRTATGPDVFQGIEWPASIYRGSVDAAPWMPDTSKLTVPVHLEGPLPTAPDFTLENLDMMRVSELEDRCE